MPRKYPASIITALVISLFAQLVSGLPSFAVANPSAITINNSVCDLATAGYLGSGTSLDPWQISDAKSLWETTDCEAQNPGSFYKLTSNIEVPSTSPVLYSRPIGYVSFGNINLFQGDFDGNGFSISNVAISAVVSANSALRISSAGLFAVLQNATFRNLSISGTSSGDRQTTFGGEELSTGGLAALSFGVLTLVDLTADFRVQGRQRVGGLVGIVENVTMSQVLVTGSVNGDASVGGFFGQSSYSASIFTSTNSASISALASSAAIDTGGFVGTAENIEIQGSANLGAVSGATNVGGLVGYANVLTFSRIVNQGAVNVGSPKDGFDGLNIGGLVGEAVLLSVENSANYGDVSAWGKVAGGLAGQVGSGTFRAVQNVGSIYTRMESPGGLVGRAQNLRIENSANLGSVSGNTQIGGLVSRVTGQATFVNSLNVGATIQTPSWNFETVGDSSVNRGSTSAPGVTVIEGLIAFGTFTASSTVTTPPASRSATLSRDQFRFKENFTGWDFDAIWGYRCSDTSPVPRLRIFYPSSNLSSATCPIVLVLPPEPQSPTLPPNQNLEPPGPNSTVSSSASSSVSSSSSPSSNSGSGGGQGGSGNPSAPQVIGTYSAMPASSLKIDGHSLDSVTKVWIGTFSASISKSSQAYLVMQIPNLLPEGSYDLLLQTNFGNYRFFQAIRILTYSASESALVGKSKLLPKFGVGVTSLNETQKLFMQRLGIENSTYRVVCTAITSPKMVRQQRVFLRTRALVVCREILKLAPETKIWVQSKESRNKFAQGRVLLTFKR